jgi:hypothetical protein
MNSIILKGKNVVPLLCDLPVGKDKVKVCCVCDNDFWFWEDNDKYVINLSSMKLKSVSKEPIPSEFTSAHIRNTEQDHMSAQFAITCMSVLVAAAVGNAIYCTMGQDYIMSMLMQLPKELKKRGIDPQSGNGAILLYRNGREITWMQLIMN